MKSINN